MINSLSFCFGYNEAKLVSEDWNFSWDQKVFQIDFHRIYFITSGKGIIRFKDDSYMEILPNHLYFVPAYWMKETKTLETMYQYYIHFKIDSPALNAQLEMSTPQQTELSKSKTSYLINLFQKIFLQTNNHNFHSLLDLTKNFSILLSMAVHNISSYSQDSYSFLEIINYIDSHLSQPILIENLAEMMGYNVNYFSSKFKKVFDLPPQIFILKKRLNTSIKYLAETDLSIEQIAYSCGFNSCAYYIRQFKNEFLMTPKQFRADKSTNPFKTFNPS